MDRSSLGYRPLFLLGFLNAQTSVQGTVSDQNGDPLAGANVVVSGTSVGAASDAEGSYQINIPSGTVEGQTVTLEVSYIGYKSQSANVDIPQSGSVTQNFSLEVDAIGLQAISVTALGFEACLLYTSPSPRDKRQSRMPSSA